MRVRTARHADFAAIAAVELSAGELFAGTHMAWAVGETTNVVDLAEAAAAGMLWVAEEDREIAGFLLAEVCGKDLHIWEIAVHRDWQRRGTGRALLETATAAGAARGCSQATLTTDRQLAWNAPYYASLGFAELAGPSCPARLAAQMASEPQPHLRCAMSRAISPSAP